jgi:hypothetical protein
MDWSILHVGRDFPVPLQQAESCYEETGYGVPPLCPSLEANFHCPVEAGHKFTIQQCRTPFWSWAYNFVALVKPFADTRRLNKQQRFSEKICRARAVVENAFGRLKWSWQCLMKCNDCNVDFVKRMTLPCYVLHKSVSNIMKCSEGSGILPQVIQHYSSLHCQFWRGWGLMQTDCLIDRCCQVFR